MLCVSHADDVCCVAVLARTAGGHWHRDILHIIVNIIWMALRMHTATDITCKQCVAIIASWQVCESRFQLLPVCVVDPSIRCTAVAVVSTSFELLTVAACYHVRSMPICTGYGVFHAGMALLLQTGALLLTCVVCEGALLFLVSNAAHKLAGHVARSLAIIHVLALGLCSIFGFVWQHAVTKVRQHSGSLVRTAVGTCFQLDRQLKAS